VDQEGTLGLTVISVLIGLILAAAYHYLSMRLQTWASKRNAGLVPAIALLGFFIRLTAIAVVLVILGLWAPVQILPLCLAFVVLFTVLNALWLHSLVAKRRGVPPSPGASGAH
jgi:predicted outer membrane lipoprotein